MGFDELNQEAQAKARAAETMEDLEELASEYGQELSDNELEQINGGYSNSCPMDGICPKAVDMSGRSCPGFRFG